MKLICWLKRHKRGETKVEPFGNEFMWKIKCSRCGKKLSYLSPRTRLVGTELAWGFDGN